MSLPKPWIKKYNVQKGAELDIQEQGAKIIVRTESAPVTSKLVIDVTGMDSSIVRFYLRNAYRKGYDEIEVKYDKNNALHMRTGEEHKISSILHDEIARLVGFEIIQQKANSCIVKAISDESTKDFNNILRRIFLLLIDAFEDISMGLKKGDKNILENMEERRYNITTFISYSFRLLAKKGEDISESYSYYYDTISSLEEITDLLKWVARDSLKMCKKPLSKKAVETMDQVVKSFSQFYDLFYKFNTEKVINMYKGRHKTLIDFKNSVDKIPAHEVLILSNAIYILDILAIITSKTEFNK